MLRNIVAGAAAMGMAGKAVAKASDRNIVGLTEDADFGVARQHADSVHHEMDFGGVGKAVAGKFPDEALAGLENHPQVRYVEDDGVVQAYAQTLPWGIDRVDADIAHSNGDTGSGADIAIIDTGIDADHPDLQANIGTGSDFTGTGSWDDDNGHGTHCAGIADAVNNSEGVVGVSTEATLHAAKVLDSGGGGTFADVAAGIEWVANQGYDVGSLSLGASSGTTALQDACQYANNNGVLLVAAAGNSGPCSNCVGYPAAYSECLAVSSTNSSDGLSSFSSTGSEVEIAAPGSSIYSTYMGGGYDTLSGTSMATPHVSGAAGQLMANGASNSDARSQLKSTAEDIGLGSNESGSGLLDVEAALGGGGGGDGAPSVSFANPSDGSTVSGSVTVQISASDSEDSAGSLSVTYNVDGGSSRSTTYNSTSGYYEDSLDTTTLSDGSHNLNASATDSAGNTTTTSISTTVDNNTGGGGNAPTVDSFTVSTRTTGPWTRATGDWAVSDSDGDLSSVTLELVDSGGSVLDSASTSVSGSSASGSNELKTRNGTPSELVLTVTDAAGNSTTASQSV